MMNYTKLSFLFFALALGISWSTSTFAQSASKVEDLNIRILPPKIDARLDLSIISKLEQKVLNIFTQENIVNNRSSVFAVQPILGVVEFGKLEGISTEETVILEFGLIITNIFSEQIFLVFSHNLSGSGKTQKSAVNRAINSIRPQKKAYTDFIQGGRQKINNYYQDNCTEITADAQRAIQNNDYEKAVSLLYVIPAHTNCSKSNQDLLVQAYNQFQSQNCQSLIQQAEVAILKKDLKDAIDLIGQIDPTSPCKDEAKKLLQSVSQKVDEQTKKKMDFLNKVYNDNVAIEKVRQQSMKSISNTYIEGIDKD